MTRFFLKLCAVLILVCGLPDNAKPARWQSLGGTSRYKAAYDEQSVRSTPAGNLEISFLFSPRGETERKAAVLEYREKRYRAHTEFYEIDCGNQTATLGHIDVLGTSRVQLKRLQKNSQPDPILPGSLLDNAAQRICPVLDRDPEENEADENRQAEESDTSDDSNLNSQIMQQIENLQKKATSKEATADTWKELGNIYFDVNRPEQAIKAYENALALRPDDADTLNDQGAMYRQTGNFEQALANFEKAYSINPTNLESLYNSSYVCAFDLNNIPKALVLWRQYLEHDSASETGRQVQSFVEQYGK